ncbi:hypothetical protein VPNG_00897 [Cytospora leucostoma]|uniref:Uncharacterized protein n=1 Tax=Cytospora leucostoma TaxID=1230097 RepID=A0A423XLZ7_9PEZI|nr:hypothetical protein VPNG_00897 [Cytospora leucostoma]
MATPFPLSLLTMITCFVSASLQQRDPVQNFCRRFGHQTTVIDNNLYIDGGLINWNPISTYEQNYSNTWLLYQSLAHNGASGMPQLRANLSKNASVPSVSGGALWGDDVNKRFYLFGGEYHGDTPPAPFSLYAYDALNDWWDDLGPVSGSSSGGSVINPVSYGAGVGISELGLGFYYGGWLSNDSVAGWEGAPVATTGLVKFDMDQGTWTNNSGPDSVRRAGGSMDYIPASDGGMLVYFGGARDPQGNGSTVGQPMDEIFIHDIYTGQWYTQKTSGTTPQMRQRFCSGVTWADDQSSYNIYIYGGAGMPPDTAGYDDVYILTIPTFTWIKLYPTDGNITGQYPHNSLSCNVINRSQMLIIGGTFPLSDDACDAAPQWGTHNLVLGHQDDANPWQLYSPNLTTYAVPDAVTSVVGGQRAGGATRTAPSGGFDNPDLRVLMTKTASIAARTPTRAVPGGSGSTSSSSSSGGGGTHLSRGAIAGIAVGGSVALIAALAGLCLVARRRHRFRYGAAGGGGGRGPSGPKSSAGGSSAAYPYDGPGSPAWSPTSPHSGLGSTGVGGLHTPNSYYGPPDPFARRPSNINIQQGPAELAAPVPRGGAGYEMQHHGGGVVAVGAGLAPRALRASGRSASSGGGDVTVLAHGEEQPKFDDSGRPWYPRVSRLDDGPYPPPRPLRSVSYNGESPGYSPVTQSSPISLTTTAAAAGLHEMSAEPPARGSDTGWEGGGTGSSGQTGSGRSGSRSERRETRGHTTFYNP